MGRYFCLVEDELLKFVRVLFCSLYKCLRANDIKTKGISST